MDRKRYTAEFKREAVRQAGQRRFRISDVANGRVLPARLKLVGASIVRGTSDVAGEPQFTEEAFDCSRFRIAT